MRRIQWWLVLLCGIAGLPSAAGAGPFAGAGIYTVLVLDDKFEFVVRIEQPFAFEGSDSIIVGGLGGFGSGVLSFDPDPVAGYDFTIENTTGGAIQGVVVLDLEIEPSQGGVPAVSEIGVAYTDGGGGGIDNGVQQTTFLTEYVGSGRDTFLSELDLRHTITTEAPISDAAGPTPLPEPGSGQYERLAVQFSFDLEAGDTVSFAGSTMLNVPEPRASTLAAAALLSLTAAARRRRARPEVGPEGISIGRMIIEPRQRSVSRFEG